MNGRRSPGAISITPSRPGSPSSAASLVLLLSPLTVSSLSKVARRNVYPAPNAHASHLAPRTELEPLPAGLRRSS